jgi:hypothetical protein
VVPASARQLEQRSTHGVFGMKWTERDIDLWVSKPYQIERGINGWTAFVYTVPGRCLGQRMSLRQAKEACEKDAANHDLA